MLRIDGAYLYELGAVLRSISYIPSDRDLKKIDLYFTCWKARETLEQLFRQSIFSGSLRSSASAAKKSIEELSKYIPSDLENVNWEETIYQWHISSLKENFSKFEAVLTADLQSSALYFVSAKGGYDTVCLTDRGESLFPQSLAHKVPTALPDVLAGARCLAFELPTAAGFHFHRANEAVLRKYFDEVAGEENRPGSRNMGDYINKMKQLGVGDDKVIAVLKSLKDLHRNPLMHPDESIDSIEEAISLQCAVRAAVGYMLDRISDCETLPAVAPLPFEGPIPTDG